jgi:hypothetical protein
MNGEDQAVGTIRAFLMAQPRFSDAITELAMAAAR